MKKIFLITLVLTLFVSTTIRADGYKSFLRKSGTSIHPVIHETEMRLEKWMTEIFSAVNTPLSDREEYVSTENWMMETDHFLAEVSLETEPTLEAWMLATSDKEDNQILETWMFKF